MIVSFRHKFIFVAIPKTGTHAVRQALREHLGPEDIEQVGLFVDKRFPMPELAQLEHGHISLQQLRAHLPPEQFDSFFKFAFVRNPFDRSKLALLVQIHMTRHYPEATHPARLGL